MGLTVVLSLLTLPLPSSPQSTMLSMLSTILVTSLMVTLTTSLQCFSCDEGSRDASKKCSDIVVEQVEECPDSNYSCETKWENNGQLRKKGCWDSLLPEDYVPVGSYKGCKFGKGMVHCYCNQDSCNNNIKAPTKPSDSMGGGGSIP